MWSLVGQHDKKKTNYTLKRGKQGKARKVTHTQVEPSLTVLTPTIRRRAAVVCRGCWRCPLSLADVATLQLKIVVGVRAFHTRPDLIDGYDSRLLVHGHDRMGCWGGGSSLMLRRVLELLLLLLLLLLFRLGCCFTVVAAARWRVGGLSGKKKKPQKFVKN